MRIKCTGCLERYSLETQSPACPHEPKTGPMPAYGWRVPVTVSELLRDLYLEGREDELRCWLGHSNPLVAALADGYIESLKLCQEIASKVQDYESDAQADDRIPTASTGHVLD